jgi:hypothetical protein
MTTGKWSPEELVSSESDLYSRSPHLAIDSKDNVHVVWDDKSNIYSSDTDIDIFYKYRDSTSETWSSLLVVSAQSTSNSYDADIVIDDYDNIHFLWKDITDYQGAGTDQDLFYQMIDQRHQLYYPTEVVTVGSDYSFSGQDIAVDKAGNPHIVWSANGEVNGFYGPLLYTFKTDLSQKFADTSQYNVELSRPASVYPKILVGDAVYFLWEELAPGSDHDIAFRYFSGPPATPTLEVVQPHNSLNGEVDLVWTRSNWADDYYVYRDTSPILSTSGLTPLTIIEENHFQDQIDGTGRYYYAVHSAHSVGFSDLSNNVYVDVVQASSVGNATVTIELDGNRTTITEFTGSALTDSLPLSSLSMLTGLFTILSIFIILRRKNKV